MYLPRIAVNNVCSVTMKRVVCNHYDMHYVLLCDLFMHVNH